MRSVNTQFSLSSRHGSKIVSERCPNCQWYTIVYFSVKRPYSSKKWLPRENVRSVAVTAWPRPAWLVLSDAKGSLPFVRIMWALLHVPMAQVWSNHLFKAWGGNSPNKNVGNHYPGKISFLKQRILGCLWTWGKHGQTLNRCNGKFVLSSWTGLLDFNHRSVSFRAPLSARQTWQRKFPILKGKHILVDIRLTHLWKESLPKLVSLWKSDTEFLYTILLVQHATTWWPAAGGGTVLIHTFFVGSVTI